MSSLKQIGASVLHDSDYQGFSTFFSDVWASKHEYIVIFARRCYALNNAFLRMNFEEKERMEKAERIMTQNALLLYAGEFAQCYQKNGSFPRVLLVDDIMLHGRGVAKVLHDFESLICQELEEIWKAEEFSDNDRYYVHRNLVAATDIWIYAINEAPALIDTSLMRRITYVKKQRGNDLKDLSLRISNCLQKLNEPNTSYRYSFPIPKSKLLNPAETWQPVNWQYRGRPYTVYFKKLHDNKSFFPMVYTHGMEYIKTLSGDTEEYIWATGVAVGGDISTEAFNKVCTEVIEVLQDEAGADKEHPDKFSFLIRTLQNKNDLLQRQKVQLISFFLSAVHVYDFCQTYGIDIKYNYQASKEPFRQLEKTVLFDTHKVVTNFGKKADVNDAIWALFVENSQLIRKLWDPLGKLQQITSQLSVEGNGEAPEDYNTYNRMVEDIFYRLGTDSEYEAYEISTNKKRFMPSAYAESPDVISLCKCISEAEQELGRVNMHSALACLTVLVDCGLAAMNFVYNPVSKEVRCMFKAGELSTYTVPRRYHWFIPALVLIEKEYYDQGERCAALNEFIDQLSLDEDQTEPGNGADEDEKKALAELKGNGRRFIDRIYRCGQKLSDWDINLVSADDWADGGQAGSYLDFRIRSNMRRNVYILKAREFLQKKWFSRFS